MQGGVEEPVRSGGRILSRVPWLRLALRGGLLERQPSTGFRSPLRDLRQCGRPVREAEAERLGGGIGQRVSICIAGTHREHCRLAARPNSGKQMGPTQGRAAPSSASRPLEVER